MRNKACRDLGQVMERRRDRDLVDKDGDENLGGTNKGREIFK